MADLGQPTGDFWSLSPRTFVEILDRYTVARRARHVRADFRAGLVASILSNVYRKKGAAVVGPDHWFPELADMLAESEPDPETNMHEILARVVAINAAMGGRDERAAT